jgi:SAM-dependent methyltransferase
VTAAFWDERYRSSTSVWSGDPNPQLVTEVSGLAAGHALDVGSGEGADAIWLAQRGWCVTAVDISTVALQRSAAIAEDAGGDVAGRIEWRQPDITAWVPDEAAYYLVSVQFMQLPKDVRDPAFRRLAASVAPDGTLLVVGHHPSDLETSVRRPRGTDLLYPADDVAALLEPSRWRIAVNAARERMANDPAGHSVAVHDSVLRAQRRP